MKLILTSLLCATLSFASIDTINSFQADFSQNVTDDKNVTLNYSGRLSAQRPQDAVWNYLKPIQKDVYIDRFRVTIVEPEIEQVIIRKIETKFDFFTMIKNSKKITENTYEAYYKDAIFLITTKDSLIESISYKDNFENSVKITFTNQKQNIQIPQEIFTAKFPLEYDIIRD